MSVAIARLHWFTSDLRLADNPAVSEGPEPVVGVFVVDQSSLSRSAGAPRRVAFLRACVEALDVSLRGLGSRLLVVAGDPADVLPALATRLGARVVTHARNHEPAATARARRVGSALAAAGVRVLSIEAGTVHEPGSILTKTGGTFQVYTPFSRVWVDRPVSPPRVAPTQWAAATALPVTDPVRWADDAVAPVVPPAGEAAAQERLATFIATALGDYPTARDLPAIDGTSRLSYHLRFGTVSAATACRAASAAAAADPGVAEGALVWRRELGWRDFFTHLLTAFPRVAREPFRPLPIRWRIDDAGFRRWQTGTTGFPLVDAGMRELAATGFMHNRVRMVTASFLTRYLLIDWRDGERHFMHELLDHQLAQNDGNWQWVAGTGADAQPFHRIFSPVRQGERFDPDGVYVKRWVPELARVPGKQLHAPWSLGPLERRGLCPDYPPPVVDPATARGRALAAFEAARRPEGRA